MYQWLTSPVQYPKFPFCFTWDAQKDLSKVNYERACPSTRGLSLANCPDLQTHPSSKVYWWVWTHLILRFNSLQLDLLTLHRARGINYPCIPARHGLETLFNNHTLELILKMRWTFRKKLIWCLQGGETRTPTPKTRVNTERKRQARPMTFQWNKSTI